MSVAESTGSATTPEERPATAAPRARRGDAVGDRLVAFFSHGVVGIVIAALSAVGLTLVILPPPMYADASWVFQAARAWPDMQGQFPQTVLHHAMRLGTIFPTRISQEIFGDGQTAWVVASIFLMMLFTTGAYALGRSLFSSWIGYATLGMLLIHPFFTVVDSYSRSYSTGTGSLVPDAPSAGTFALGVAAAAVASRRKGRAQLRWLLVAGLLWGLAYLVREYVAFMYVAIPVFFLALRIPLRRMVWPAIPMLSVLAFELVHNAIVWSDPFARLTVAGEHGNPRAEPLDRAWVVTTFVRAIRVDELGYVFAAGLALTALGAVLFRDRRLWMILAWFASLWIPLTLLGGFIDPYEPSLRPQLTRYWYLVFIPLIAGGLATVDLIVKRLGAGTRTRLVAALVGATLVLTGYVLPATAELPRVRRDADWRELRAWLATHPQVPVLLTDERTAQSVKFYTRAPSGRLIWNGQVRSFPRERFDLLPTLIGDGVYLRTKLGPKQWPSAADGWQLVWESDNRVLILYQKR